MWQCNAQALQHPSRCKIGAVDPEMGYHQSGCMSNCARCFRSKGQLDSVAERGQVLIENISCPC